LEGVWEEEDGFFLVLLRYGWNEEKKVDKPMCGCAGILRILEGVLLCGIKKKLKKETWVKNRKKRVTKNPQEKKNVARPSHSMFIS
jgi:hypothetical protein